MCLPYSRVTPAVPSDLLLCVTGGGWQEVTGMSPHVGGRAARAPLLQAWSAGGVATGILPPHPATHSRALCHGIPANRVRDRPRVPL